MSDENSNDSNARERSQPDRVQRGAMTRIDDWMAQNPWHPRVAPFAVYIVMLVPIQWLTENAPRAYPVVYSIQCLLVVWLLWRYRRLLPELNMKFHWLAIPVGVGVLIAWILLGWFMAGELAYRWQALASDGLQGLQGKLGAEALGEEPGFLAEKFGMTQKHFLEKLRGESAAFYWLSNGLRLLGMSIVVPLFEELFIRSLMLRSLHKAGPTGTGLLQVLLDLPWIGDRLLTTDAGRRASEQPPAFGLQFDATPLGALCVFGVCSSTFIFMINHGMRDYPGCIVCGVAYCLLLGATRHKGLGPVVWAHGITNGLLWTYTLYTNDWQFL